MLESRMTILTQLKGVRGAVERVQHSYEKLEYANASEVSMEIVETAGRTINLDWADLQMEIDELKRILDLATAEAAQNVRERGRPARRHADPEQVRAQATQTGMYDRDF